MLIASVGIAGASWLTIRQVSRDAAERTLDSIAQLAPSADAANRPAQGDASALFASSLNNLAGQSVKLSQYKGKILIVNFWASWCPPCIAEMPELSRFYKDHAGKGVEMVGIAIDNPTAVRHFLEQHHVSYPVLLGGMGGADLSTKLGDSQGGLPFTVVIAPSGSIAYQKLGQTTYAELQDHLPGKQS
ncbi:MAG: TlpA family protein disulfide reductase [Betaproteobacteria bacterium]|nr:TlpA family protein disulfide reductase [Betaproteobacteria bacterium]MDE2124946.1 TlpA family protein disulfide reductase [Betaproteobacteria bacterium]MDE2187090.1 TlpA family protein disulfide reductase [Betaproteobacteria bacterium]